jgi:hypothetical protein
LWTRAPVTRITSGSEALDTAPASTSSARFSLADTSPALPVRPLTPV